MKIVWDDRPLVEKVSLALVVAVTLFIAFNLFLRLKIKTTSEAVRELDASLSKPPRVIVAAFTKKIDLGEKLCPSAKAGNPNAPLMIKLFESETCPFCTAQNQVLDELLPEYGDLFYVEWYPVVTCSKEAERYRVSGVPTFVFNAAGREKPPAYGFLDKEQLRNYFCGVSGRC